MNVLLLGAVFLVDFNQKNEFQRLDEG